ncbi:TonB-dependent receptor [Natronospira bacteriovora]|uniref:TonB-dependent receptor n=1 Tax=Natronospira bacteriovora TaxID=3069753 RepID=A0ABU0W3S9_9GAMM|nr:TonB-dependent receptor [Natronospira sp. AB-CW4]MDQ2068616.1 TonB-dependent receptor [Natronospira sp. AB-CW4]
MTIDRKFLIWALVYIVLGMILGIYMAVSKDHGQHVTHAHVLLVGFVLSLLYGIIHRLWLNGHSLAVANVQFYLHQLGAIVMSLGLFLLYGHMMAETVLGPILGVASLLVLASALLMFWMVLKSSSTTRMEPS